MPDYYTIITEVDLSIIESIADVLEVHAGEVARKSPGQTSLPPL